MAAMLKACEPNGAISSEPSPVMVTMGLALVLKPSLRSTSMPGMYWPVSVIRNSGSAAQHGVERELGPREHRRRQAQLQPAQVDALLQQQEGQAQRQDRARGDALEDHIGRDQQAGQRRIHAHAAKSLDAELQQDAGQQPGARRDQPHARTSPTGPAARRPQPTPVGAHRLGGGGGQRRHQEGGGRGRPGGDDGSRAAQDQPGHAHADRDRPDPGGRQLGAQAGSLAAWNTRMKVPP